MRSWDSQSYDLIPILETANDVIRALYLIASCAYLSGWVPWSPQTDYRVAVETRLISDEWANGYGHQVERTDIRQRIQLDAFRLFNAPGLRLFFDADIGSDLGPSPQSLDLGIDDRRTVLNVYTFELNGQNLIKKTRFRLGRHLIQDAIGLDGVDGITIRSSHIPWVDVVARGGVATRRSWWAIGPDLSYFDGLSQREKVGYTVGLGIESRQWNRLSASSAWRRIFDPDIIRDEVGGNARWQTTDQFSVTASSIADMVNMRMAELGLGVAYTVSPSLSMDGRAMYQAPRFAADTIWTAFATEPFALASVGFTYRKNDLRLRLESIESIYELAADDGSSPLLNPDLKSESRAHEAYLNLGYRLSDGHHPSELGLSGRLASGFGGHRIFGAISGRFPISWPRPHRPLQWQTRLGIVSFDDPDRDRWDGLSGWALTTLAWPMEEGLSIEGSLEGYVGSRQQTRMRSLISVKMENWW